MALNDLKKKKIKPARILESCIDLIFINQPNIVRESGIRSTLHSNCHHQIIYSKLNSKTEYPPPHTNEIWDYGNAETDLIDCSKVKMYRNNLYFLTKQS